MSGPSTPAARARPAGGRLALVLLALLALGVRVGYQASLRTDPGAQGLLSNHLLGDERAYDAFAREVAAGGVERERSFYQAPLYAWLVGRLYALWPPADQPDDVSIIVPSPVHQAVFVVQHLLGVLTALLVATLGARILGRRAGLLAGLLAAVSGPVVFHETMLLKASLSLVLFVVALHLWLDVLTGRGHRWRRPLALGLVLGVGVLLRGNLFLLLGAVLASLVLPLGGDRRRWRAALVTGLTALVTLSPVTLHNLSRGELVLSTYQSGTNAAIGMPATDDLSDGLIYEPLRAGRGDARYEETDAVELAQAAEGRRLSGPEVSSFWWGRVGQAWARHTGTALARTALKLVHLFHGVEVPDVKEWAFLRRSVPWLPPGLSDLWLAGPLALLGLLCLPWRRRREGTGPAATHPAGPAGPTGSDPDGSPGAARPDSAATAPAVEPGSPPAADDRRRAEGHAVAAPLTLDDHGAPRLLSLGDGRTPSPADEAAGLVVIRGGLAVVAVTLMLFYVMGRYRLTAAPCLWLLAAGAVDRWWSAVAAAGPGLAARLRSAVTGRRGAGLAAFAALLALELSLPLPSDLNGDHTSWANAASVALGRATLAEAPDEAARFRDQAVECAERASAIAPFFPAPRQTLVLARNLSTPVLERQADRAWEAAWRLWLLTEALRVHDESADLGDVLDGPLAAVQVRAQQLMQRPSAPGGEAFVGPLLAFACRAVAQGLAQDPAGRELALVLCERSLSLRPQEAEAHMLRAVVLRRLGRLDEAEQAYRAALAGGLDSPELRNNLGNVLRGLGRFVEAADQFRAALTQRPGDPLITANLQRALAGE